MHTCQIKKYPLEQYPLQADAPAMPVPEYLLSRSTAAVQQRPSHRSHIRFLVYNIRYGTGHHLGYHLPFPFSGFFRPTAQKLDQIIEFIGSYAPDVIGLVEVDSGSYRSGRNCQAEIIARALGYSHVVETKYGDNTLAKRVPVLNKQSNAILARQAIINHRYHYFNEGIKRLVIEAELDSVVFFIVHLSLKFRHRQNQLQRLHQLIKMTDKPVVIGGDFNTFWGSDELGLFLAATGLRNANVEGIPSHPSHAPHRQIDFILHSRELQVKQFTIPDIRLSDHAPLICDLAFTESPSFSRMTKVDPSPNVLLTETFPPCASTTART